MTSSDAPVRFRAGVIGHPAAHSLSPVLHRAAYASLGLTDWEYDLRDVEPAGLSKVLAELAAPAGDGPVRAGLSVTMPHKQAMLPRLDAVDPLASMVGAANTVVAQRSGRGPALLTGFNTDVAGIVESLRETMHEPPAVAGTGFGHADEQGAPAGRTGRRAVVIGSGATACSALAALTELGATDVTVAARRHAGPGRAMTAAHRMGLEIATITWRPGEAASDEEVAEAVADADLVVSTLPSHAADTLGAPVSRALERNGGARPSAAALDVVYAPWPTRLGAALTGGGVAVAPGWLMLLHQAVPQVALMTGHRPETGPMREAVLAALAER